MNNKHFNDGYIIKIQKGGLIKIIPFAFLLFRFYIDGINKIIQLSMVLVFIALYIVNNLNFKGKKIREFVKGILFFLIFIEISIVFPLLLGTEDYTYGRKLIPYVIDIGSWTTFIIYCNKISNNSRDVNVTIAEEFCKIVTLYISFTVLCMLIPALRTFIIQHSSMSDAIIRDLQYKKYLARVSWDGFAGYKSTFMCSFGVMLSLISLKSVSSKEQRNRAYIDIIIMFVGNSFYGRTGLIASGFIVVIYILREIVLKGKTKILFKIIFIISLVLGIYTILAQFVEPMKFIYDWALEPILNYLKGNGFSSTSSDNWKTMWFRPLSLSTFLHGDGQYTRSDGRYYMQTDIGVLRLIFLWGIIPTILFYLFMFNEFTKSILYKMNKFSIIYVLVIFSLFEIKGEIIRNLCSIFIAMTLLETNSINKMNWKEKDG